MASGYELAHGAGVEGAGARGQNGVGGVDIDDRSGRGMGRYGDGGAVRTGVCFNGRVV